MMSRMKLSPLLASTLALTGALDAQTFTYSPGRYATQEGESRHTQFGSFAAGRAMFMIGNLRGNSLGIKEVALRPDWTTPLASHASPNLRAGRRWAQMTLRLSNCDIANHSETFSANPTSPPTTVFRGPMSWPDARGFTPVHPRPFNIRMPLLSTWQYAGTEDLCLDFQYQGGVLNSSPTWNNNPTYVLDAYAAEPLQIRGAASPLGASGANRGCVDSAAQWGAHTSAVITTHSLQHPTRPGRVVVESWTTFAQGPLISALGLGGNFNGFPLPGISCNDLYIDFSLPSITAPLGSSSLPIRRRTLWSVPHSPTTIGTGIWIQGMFLDSGNNVLKLTSASYGIVPDLPFAAPQNGLYLIAGNPNAVTGGGSGGRFQPIFRFGS